MYKSLKIERHSLNNVYYLVVTTLLASGSLSNIVEINGGFGEVLNYAKTTYPNLPVTIDDYPEGKTQTFTYVEG